MEERKIKVGITHGDINGIGYEVILKAFSDPVMLELCTPVIYGSPKVAAYHRKAMDLSTNFSIVVSAANAQDGKVNIVNCIEEELKVELTKPTVEGGKAALMALEKALAEYQEGLFDILVTAPINKQTIQSDSFHFPGHTEYIQERVGNGKEALMILLKGDFRVALVTGHIPVSEIASHITKELVQRKLQIFHRSLKQDFGIDNPRIAVFSLNPHAGDNGLLGSEEQDIIIPAIRKANEEGILAYGPFSPDGYFGLSHYEKFDATLAMYHDQGLAPFKALSFEDGVNFTAGLPIVRTSPDHGTAFEMAGRDEADPLSMRAAIFTAVDIWRNRQAWNELQEGKMEKRELADAPRKERPGKPQIA